MNVFEIIIKKLENMDDTNPNPNDAYCNNKRGKRRTVTTTYQLNPTDIDYRTLRRI